MLVEVTTGRRQRAEEEQTFCMVDSIFLFCEEVLLDKQKPAEVLYPPLVCARMKNKMYLLSGCFPYHVTKQQRDVYDASLTRDFSVS